MKKPIRFNFGENWLDYSEKIDQNHIDSVVVNLKKLFLREDFLNKKVLDIGSGSGIHDIGFYTLGCTNLLAFDYDITSVSATANNLKKWAPKSHYRVLQRDILDDKIFELGKFDIVYSWGVLHHTGELRKAIRNSCELVESNGLFALAIYKKTPLCFLWRIEKKMYSMSPKLIRYLFELSYIFFYSLALLLFKRISIVTYAKNYKSRRGMSFYSDVKDWLGGYPYESISATELSKIMKIHGFTEIHSFESEQKLGIFGSGCNEYLFKKGS